MNEIRILDCTLRDGGYCNQWKFGFSNVNKIIAGLVESEIDIIEVGFINEKIVYDKDITKFDTINRISDFIPENKEKKLFVAMLNLGDYDISKLPEYDENSIDGIRVAFHKKGMDDALKVCSQIKQKGYKVFVQAMVSLCYTDEEFLSMIRKVNEIQPYAFYIVDSFGMIST